MSPIPNTEGQKHVHKFEPTKPHKERLRRYVHERGKAVPDIITGYDLLLRRKCRCGAIETYDLQRYVA